MASRKPFAQKVSRIILIFIGIKNEIIDIKSEILYKTFDCIIKEALNNNSN